MYCYLYMYMYTNRSSLVVAARKRAVPEGWSQVSVGNLPSVYRDAPLIMSMSGVQMGMIRCGG